MLAISLKEEKTANNTYKRYSRQQPEDNRNSPNIGQDSCYDCKKGDFASRASGLTFSARSF